MTPDFIAAYRHTLETALHGHDWSNAMVLAQTLQRCWRDNRQVFLRAQLQPRPRFVVQG